MTEIFKPMTFGPPWRKRQDRIESVEGLNSALFIDAEDGGMGGRLQVESNDVGRLLLEFRVIADQVTAPAVRLKAVPSPNPRNRHVIGAKLDGQPAAAPVGGSVLRATTGPLQNARLKLCGIRAHLATLMTGHQSCKTACQKALSPALNIGRTAPKHAGYCTHSKPRAQRKDDLSAPRILGSNRSRPNPPTQFSAFRRTNHNSLVLHSLTMTDCVSHINVTLH